MRHSVDILLLAKIVDWLLTTLGYIFAWNSKFNVSTYYQLVSCFGTVWQVLLSAYLLRHWLIGDL